VLPAAALLPAAQRHVVRSFRGKMWLCCRLDVDDRSRKVQRDDNRAFNGRKRTLMAPRRYTELFFLDEATALAAGHRPCGCCRRADFARFMECWQAAQPRDRRWTASDVDAVLHSERLAPSRTAPLSSLPDGAFVTLEPADARAVLEPGQDRACWLKWSGKLHRWSHLGYTEQRDCACAPRHVDVLTPPSICATLEAGFRPALPHPSALEPDGTSHSLHSSSCGTGTPPPPRVKRRKLPVERGSDADAEASGTDC
jgi:hypothetical protein